MDEIRIERLKVFAHHGVLPSETKKGQNFYVNATLHLDVRPAGRADDLEQSVNYAEVCHFLHHFLTEHTYLLIESAAERAASALLVRFPLVRAVDLEVCKPHAPIGLPFQDVSVTVHRAWHTAYVGIGSNLGDRKAHIRHAMEKLSAFHEVRLVSASSLLETKPYGGVEQENFLNGVLKLETILPPEELLEKLRGVEASEGRDRSERAIHWGPRTLDLDILFYDREVYESDTLVIPHVDLENRYFVLKPLSELAPNLRHPILHKTVLQLLTALPADLQEGSEA